MDDVCRRSPVSTAASLDFHKLKPVKVIMILFFLWGGGELIGYDR